MGTFEIYTGDDTTDKRYPYWCFFTNQCKEKFSFLLKEYNFKLMKTEMMGTIAIDCTFQSPLIGLHISFDPRDGLFVFFVKLVKNKVGLYDPKTHFSVKKCLRLKSIEKTLYTAVLTSELNKVEIIEALEEHAKAVQEHCQDLLSGDFTCIENANKNNM